MRFCWAQYAHWAVIAVLGTLGMLAGCGAKGDLYLPPEDKAAAQPAAPKNVESTYQSQPQPEAQPR
jgi:predicted small lipoprotein YifL